RRSQRNTRPNPQYAVSSQRSAPRRARDRGSANHRGCCNVPPPARADGTPRVRAPSPGSRNGSAQCEVSFRSFSSMDLIVRNARLADRRTEGPLDIGVAGGKIAAIEHGLAADAAEKYDAGGRLVCAGLIETHIHLDKPRIIDRCPPEARRDISPMRQVAGIKPNFTVEDVRLRAERTLVECIMNGATRMRTQLEVDPAIGMRSFDAVQ